MSGMTDVILIHSQIGRDENGQYCKGCGHRYGYAAERTLHRAAASHVTVKLMEDGFGKVEARRQAGHQCEAWQIEVNIDGTRRYCAACGKIQL